MSTKPEPILPEVLQAFAFPGTVTDCSRYGEGHINDTFAVKVSTPDGERRYILQRINTDTFKDPAGLMENIVGVTQYLRRIIEANGGDPLRETLNFLPDRTGRSYYTDSMGGAWRLCLFVEGTVCLQQVENAGMFKLVGEAFGNFQNQLAEYPAATLHETIAHFHDTPSRYRAFEDAVSADPLGRAAGAAEEIAFVRARREDCHVLTDLLDAGKLPLRVTHNDTKMNNVLLDAKTGKGLCVIDLDTVMPGLAAYDFGDTIRFGANDCAEDEPDQSKVHFSLPLFNAFTEGFVGTAKALTETEKRTLPWGARLMTLECGMRFLTDYLVGDTYFHISRPAQNLDRARTQFTLVRQMEENWDALEQAMIPYL
ncbi:MAG: aminoglycoside phosphotransferase family protein [Gemmiger sp.]|uniref:phosphotransferase enzyme family protein n=1 Tax=Gemmiger sp. TaxID=2049027 RepID=UPI002E76A35B|nr:aminoglycoside phosphotransferase family protein [Gemmiger sp.]MEE0800523.1 aminoglycoside phosphotransferase family protein [Gemmiger sp.]